MCKDAILALLHAYQVSPQNPHNAPMQLSDIAYAVLLTEEQGTKALDALKRLALIREPQPKAYSLSAAGKAYLHSRLEAENACE